MWAATSCLGAWRPFIRGAAARFAPFHLQQLGPYHLIYCLCGTVGPWVKVPKALEEDTPMWVYGVGPAPGQIQQHLGILMPPEHDMPGPSEPTDPFQEAPPAEQTVPHEETTTVEIETPIQST
ncbi:hypothetical protein CK203_103630 [Vitis vinifera]|uniref:Uncharacterized protein n=1 Tax=Vitis vinifera TaxID=29760 RepID=A0A438BPZ5_VITVI|nr:hypothetical protein CK203_103630 [Vitis vinifera]